MKFPTFTTLWNPFDKFQQVTKWKSLQPKSLNVGLWIRDLDEIAPLELGLKIS